MDAEKHLDELLAIIQRAVDGFNDSIPRAQVALVEKLETLLRDLELSGGTIKATAENLRTVSRIKGEIEALVISPTYERNVTKYLAAFNEITAMQQAYFSALEGSVGAEALLRELKKQSINATLSSLTRAGISVNVVDPIQDILRANVTTGVQYSEMRSQIRTFIEGNEQTVGHLSKYIKQITTDALNQYAAQYLDIVSNDLGLDWFQYSGVKIATSRAFCVAMVNKRFFHRSELPALLRGDFPEFKEANGRIYDKTGLPDGMVAGTNPENFFVYRGGYFCNHQPVPVSEVIVPKAQRVRVYDSEGISYDKDGYQVAA